MISEEADRYTICLLKRQHGVDTELPPEPKVDYSKLYDINRLMWRIEDIISGSNDLEMIGALYLALRGLTKCRIAEKNKIAEQYGEPIETKTY